MKVKTKEKTQGRERTGDSGTGMNYKRWGVFDDFGTCQKIVERGGDFAGWQKMRSNGLAAATSAC